MEARKDARERKEAREQAALEWFINSKNECITQTPMPEWSSFDNWLHSGGTDFCIEIKMRTEYSSTQIKRFGGAILEFEKLNGILSFQSKNHLSNRILYANFFNDEVQIFELDPNPKTYTWELKYLQKDDYSKEKVWKWVSCLPQSKIIETRKYK